MTEPGRRCGPCDTTGSRPRPRPPGRATTVAGLYADLGARFILDRVDADQAEAIRAVGVPVQIVDTVLHGGASAGRLVQAVLG